MSKQAIFVGTPYVIGGQKRVFTTSDFIFIRDGVTVVPPGFTINFGTISGPAYSDEANTLTGYKHARSVSKEDDVAGGHYNTVADDFSTGTVSVSYGSITDDDNVHIYEMLNLTLTYYAAAYPPNYPIARVAGLLKSSANNYAGIFSGGAINQYSPVKPNKIAPHSAGELVGYSPTMVGELYAKMLYLDSADVQYDGYTAYTRTIRVSKYPIVTVDVSNLSVEIYKDGGLVKKTASLNLSSIPAGSIGTTFSITNDSIPDVTASIEFRLLSNSSKVYTFYESLTLYGKYYAIASSAVAWYEDKPRTITFTLSKDASSPDYPSTLAVVATYKKTLDGIHENTATANITASKVSGNSYSIPVTVFSPFVKRIELAVKNSKGITIGRINEDNPNPFTTV